MFRSFTQSLLTGLCAAALIIASVATGHAITPPPVGTPAPSANDKNKNAKRAPNAVREIDRVAELIAELPRDIGADHGVVEIVERLTGSERHAPVAGVAIVLEVVAVGAHHAKTAMRVTE